MNIVNLRHSAINKIGHQVTRPNGFSEFYSFVHFLAPVKMTIHKKEIDIPPNSCILYNVNTPQLWRASTDLVQDWIRLSGDVPKYVEKYNLQFDKIYTFSNSSFIFSITRDLEKEYNSKNVFWKNICDDKLEELFAKISRNENHFIKSEDLIERQFRALRVDVFSNLKRDWKIIDMAKKISYSESYFYATYKSIFGISPIQDLINCRLENAEALLLENNKSIKSIANEIGYNNIFNFLRQFKKFYGVTPSEYRKKYL